MGKAAYSKVVSVATAIGETFDVIPASSASLSESGTVLDDTVFHAEGHRSRLLGLLDWSASVTAFYGSETALTTLRTARTSRTEIYFKYMPPGAAAGSGYKGPCIVESINSSGEVDGLETMEISLQATGALVADDAT